MCVRNETPTLKVNPVLLVMINIDDGSLITQPLSMISDDDDKVTRHHGSVFLEGHCRVLFQLYRFITCLISYLWIHNNHIGPQQHHHEKNHFRTKYICFPGTCQCKKMSVSLISYWTKIGMCNSSTDVLPPGVLCVLYTRTSTRNW